MDTIDVSAKYLVTNITRAAKATGNTVVQLGNRIAESVNLLFAPGHVGLTGVQIQYAGNTLLPFNQGALFVYGDNERLDYELGMYLPGPVTIRTTNTDTVPHSFQITFKVLEVALPGLLPVATPIPLVVS